VRVPLTIAAVTVRSWIAAGAVIAAAILLLFGVQRVLNLIEKRFAVQQFALEMIGRVLRTIIVVIGLLYVLDLLEIDIGPLIGGLGVSGIIVAVALQPVFGNMLGSVLLHGGRPIRPGDQIDTNGISGTVVDISNRSVEIVDFDGDRIYIPNLAVLDAPLKNRTADEIRRSSMPFQVSYDTNLRDAQRLLVKAIRGVDGVVDIPGAEVTVRGFGDSGVDMLATFWHPSEQLSARWIISEVAITIREELHDNNITIPFPHRVIETLGAPAQALQPLDEIAAEREPEPSATIEDEQPLP